MGFLSHQFHHRGRPVSQWVGGDPAAVAATASELGDEANSTEAVTTATAATAALETQIPEEERKASVGGATSGASDGVDAGAPAAAGEVGGAVGETAVAVAVAGIEAGGDGTKGNAEEKSLAERDDGVSDAVAPLAEKKSAEGVSEADGGKATEVRGSETIEKDALAAKTLEKTPSVLEMLKSKRGMGIFGKSSLVQNKVSPSPTLSATPAASAAMPSFGGGQADATDAMPEPKTEELRVEVDDSTVAEGIQATNGTAEEGKDKVTTTPSVLDIPSRFKMSMGMFGGGKSSPSGAPRGWGATPTPATAAAAAAPAPSAGPPVTVTPGSNDSPAAAGESLTPSSSSGGAGKFSSYARRAGNFLGKERTQAPRRRYPRLLWLIVVGSAATLHASRLNCVSVISAAKLQYHEWTS